MDQFSLLLSNLTTPAVLAFALGFIAVKLRSDLKLPDAISQGLTIYLLLAIGLKGGAALRSAELSTLWLPLLAVVVLGIVRTLSSFVMTERFLGAKRNDAAAFAAHFGSVSALTFIAAEEFFQAQFGSDQSSMVGLLVVLEIPALVLAVLLARRGEHGAPLSHVLRDVFVGKSIILLLGGLLIGILATESSLKQIKPFFTDLFAGALVLLLLDLGQFAARQLRQEGGLPWPWVAVSVALALAHGVLGAVVGLALGMNQAGASVLAAMCASASYIAAPTAMRIALPDAQLARCLIAALCVVFPFNLSLGIPFYAWLVEWLSS